MAKIIIDQLQDTGAVTRGWLGVGIQDLDSDLKEYYGIDHGVLVTEVFPDQPAEKSGIEANDIILTVNGEKIDSTRGLSRIISGLPVGEKTVVEVYREGKIRKIDVIIGKRDDDSLARAEKPEIELGIHMSELTPEMAERLNMREAKGVVVTDVDAGSIGARAGIRAGDVILELNRQPVEKPADFSTIIRKLDEKDPIQIYLRRPQRGFMVITIRR